MLTWLECLMSHLCVVDRCQLMLTWPGCSRASHPCHHLNIFLSGRFVIIIDSSLQYSVLCVCVCVCVMVAAGVRVNDSVDSSIALAVVM